MSDEPTTQAGGEALHLWHAPRIDEVGGAADAELNPANFAGDLDGGGAPNCS